METINEYMVQYQANGFRSETRVQAPCEWTARAVAESFEIVKKVLNVYLIRKDV